MHCGQQLAQVEMPRGPQPVGYPPQPAAVPRDDRRGTVVIVVVCLLIVALLMALGLWMNSLMKTTQVTAAPVRALGSATPAPVKAEEISMPDEIRAYLEHVRKTEEMRMATAKTQVSRAVIDAQLGQQNGIKDNLSGLLDPDMPPDAPSPAIERPKGDITSMRQDWLNLGTTFNTVKPPSECINIHDKYDETIRETGGAILDILDSLSNALSDPQGAIRKLGNISDQSSLRIDKPAQVTDQLIADICNKYNTHKWFEIHSDIGSSALSKVTMPDASGIR